MNAEDYCRHKLKGFRIGVIGSASGPLTKDQIVKKRAYELGRAVALNNCTLVNGARPGLPDDAAKGAKEEGGIVIGISPAYSKEEHCKFYKSPLTADFILYTGMGFMERDIINIRTSDAVIIVGGGIGTLNEFTIAYDEQRPIGLLTKTKGMAAYIPDILKAAHRKMDKNVISDDNPDHLVKKLREYTLANPRPVHEDSRIYELGLLG